MSKAPSITTACEQCRFRKIKCDKARPRCGACEKSVADCFYLDESFRRGPKKGELARLKAQVATLTEQLAAHRHSNEKSSQGRLSTSPGSTTGSSDIDVDASHSDGSGSLLLHLVPARSETEYPGLDPKFSSWLDPTLPSPGLGFPSSFTFDPSSLHWGSGEGEIVMNKLVRADLEATYFERAHSFIPMLHRDRFHSWVELPILTPSQNCLRSAVWTLAAALCPRFRGMYESLYAQTRQLLQTLNEVDQGHLWSRTNAAHLERIQAWIIIGHCELSQNSHQAATLSATRISRFVQLACLGSSSTGDKPSDPIGQPPSPGYTTDYTLEQERCRTFWVAYSFGRMVNSFDHGLSTLEDEPMHFSLPCFEDAFQDSVDSTACSLAEALRNMQGDTLSCLAESTIIVTIYGRCLTHRRLAAIARATGQSSSIGTFEETECLERHTWLMDTLHSRLHSRAKPSVKTSTPLLILAHLLSLGCIVHLLETLVEHVRYDSQHVHEAFDAIASIAHFAGTLPQALCFNMHPFLPMILTQAARFLNKYRYFIGEDQDATCVDRTLEGLVMQLEKFEDVHILAKTFLEEFRSTVV